ncbi:MAG: hypothetical protein VKQ33_01535 [Candidatus Sericytochromatia bacterium]|nr:hypothetical protein [Candidatus Sericytochromatia bacterium]
MKMTSLGRAALPPLLAAVLAACGGPQPTGTAPGAVPPVSTGEPAGPGQPPAAASAPEEPLRLGGLVQDRPWNTSVDDFDWSTGADDPVVVVVDDPGDAEGGATPGATGTPASATPAASGTATAAEEEADAPVVVVRETGFGALGQSGLVAFSSNRDTGGGYGADIFVYDHSAGTVLALPGVNTGADEINPRVSANGRWLIYATDVNGDWDIYLYDVKTGLVDMLPTLNTEYDEVAPTVDDAGTTIAYVMERGGYQTLGLHDLTTGRSFVPTTVAQLGGDVRTPWLSGDGSFVAFTADVDYTGWDIFIYDIEGATLISPPFVNSPDDEVDPALNGDGSLLVFSTDRMGSDDIMLADMTSGVLDRLMLANSPYDERSPRFLGGDDDAIVFNTDRTGDRRLMLYHPGAGVIDTLPIMHEIGSDDEMVDQSSSAGGIGGGLFGRSLGGRGGIRGGIGRFW